MEAMIADRQRRVTDINQLLNPQSQSLHGVHHNQNLDQVHHGGSVASHGHRGQQAHGDQLYHGHYPIPSSSYNLAPVDWDGRRKNGDMHRYQQSPMNMVNGVYGHQTSSNQPTNDGYGLEGWPQVEQHMFGNGSGAVSGQYPPNNYAAEQMYRENSTTTDAYFGQLQIGERASVRVVRQRTQQHHHQAPSQPEASLGNWVSQYPSRDLVNNNNAYSNPTPSSSTFAPPHDNEISATTSSSTSQSRKRNTPPATDLETQPKPKKSRKKAGDETTSRSSAGSNNNKRGYSQKKRNETAQIVAQNATLMSKVSYAQDSSGKGKEKADERMRIVDPENNGVNVAKLTPELQVGRCMAARYKSEEFPRCLACTRRWQGDTCRFQGIRFFLRDAESRIVGVSFVNNQKAEKKTMEFSKSWNAPLTMEDIKRTKSVTARALLPVLENEYKHVQATEIIYRPRESEVRATCDTCMTSLFCSSWMCRICGRESCSDCYEQLKELTGEIPNATPEDLERQRRLKERHAYSNPFFLTCTKRNDHRAAEFTPVSRFCLAELEEAISMMKEIVYGDDSRDGGRTPELEVVGSGASSASGSSGVRTPTDTSVLPSIGNHKQASTSHGQQQHLISHAEIDPSHTIPGPSQTAMGLRHGQHQHHQQQMVYHNNNPNGQPDTTPFHQIRRFKDHELTDSVFQSIWAQGEPLLVEGLLNKFSIRWTPEYFMQAYSDQSCIIVECQTNTNQRVSVGKFFSWFGNYDASRDENKIWKLKDWPPSTDFKTAFPELYEDFSKAVPVPNYVRRDGTLNIASHFPTNAIAPDLGPKMYNAMGSSCEIGSLGSTRLHMDMADAVNIMTYASRTKEGHEGCAAWDLFKAEDSDKIRAFLKRKGRANGGGIPGAGPNAGSNQYMDAIHGQQVYLDEGMRKELYEEEGVMSYRVYQRPGEAVFIPAGCAHQVCNLSDCIKVAIDFVSPENIERCERLTKEFREQLNQGKAWKEDVLQLRSMMWFAWLSCCQQEEKRRAAQQ